MTTTDELLRSARGLLRSHSMRGALNRYDAVEMIRRLVEEIERLLNIDEGHRSNVRGEKRAKFKWQERAEAAERELAELRSSAEATCNDVLGLLDGVLDTDEERVIKIEARRTLRLARGEEC